MTEKASFSEILARLGAARVLCIGDVMLDRFIYGAIERISPEAPIPVLLVERESYMPGGAGNVVSNIAALGANATLIATTGADGDSRDIHTQLKDRGVTTELVESPSLTTTVKSRFVCSAQQMLRVDREKADSIPADIEEQVIAQITAHIDRTDVVILSDYKKGLLTDRIVTETIRLARAANKPVIVDPKGKNFARYRGATVITPNRKELEAATGMTAKTDDDVRAAAMKVIATCGITAVLATRSQDGMALIAENADPVFIPAQVREVYDVSGAGDTVIATFASALAADAQQEDAARLANIAAGIAVGKPGTATVAPDELFEALDMQAGTRKIVTAAAAGRQAERWRGRGLKVGFTNGTFDLLHPGHLSSIRQAKAACDRLVVAINSDASVKRYKGPTRPIQDQKARADILAALEMVDMVVVFEEDTPIELLKTIRPDVLVKGGQYKLEEVVGYDIVMGYGGTIVRADMEDGFSTTNTIEKMAG